MATAKEPAMDFSTEECVTFDTFSDASYPSHLIAENLERLLNYESLQGIAEVVSWIIKSAGAEASFKLTESPTKAELTKLANAIDESCISNPHPAAFPIQSPAYSKRVVSLLTTVVRNLEEAENFVVLDYLTGIVAALTSAHLQSLRYAATVFAGIFLAAISNERNQMLVKAVSMRCADVSVVIRKRATVMLGAHKPEVRVKALNDDNAGVRLAALRSLGNLDDGLERIAEMATFDVDQSVRRAALKLLISNQEKLESGEVPASFWDHIKSMSFDEDLLSRRLSAELQVAHANLVNESGRSQVSSTSAARLLVKVCDLVTDDSSATQALAHGLEKQRSNIGSDSTDFNWPKEIVQLLTTDFTKQARKGSRAASTNAKELRLLSNELSDESTQLKLLMLLCALLQIESQGSKEVVANIPVLLRRMQVDVELLSYSLVATSYLPYQSIILNSSDDEQLINDVVNIARELFDNRSEPEVLESISLIFTALPETLRNPLCSDLYQDYRLSLASLLGSKGQGYSKNNEEIDVVASKIMILGRNVDIADIVNLPVWVAINGAGKKSEILQQLLCAAAMKGSAQTMQNVVQKLAEKKPTPAVDDILRIFVAAKMRDIDIEIPLPVDVNQSEPSSESVWRAAVAAGVI